jgi:PKD repeat protein
MSSQLPTGWSWEFGDTGTSSAQNPSHQYTADGLYTVSLTAANAGGSHTRVLPQLIQVPEPGVTLQLACGFTMAVALCAPRRRQR